MDACTGGEVTRSVRCSRAVRAATSTPMSMPPSRSVAPP
jgi:hypothetical protein